eukprot:IDg17495t1
MRHSLTTRNLQKLLGVGEEDVEECGGSICLPSRVLFGTRLMSIVAYAGSLIFAIVAREPQKPEFRVLWQLPTTTKFLSLEFCTLLMGLLSFSLLSAVSSLHVRATARSDIIAKIANPVQYTAATLAVFSLAVAVPGWTGVAPSIVFWTPLRIIVHVVPLTVVLLDIVMGSRLYFRFRATCIPVFVIQMHCCAVVVYLRIFKSGLITRHSTILLIGLGLGWQAIGVLCAISIALLSRVTVLLLKGSE